MGQEASVPVPRKLHRAVELRLLSETEYDVHELRKWYQRFLRDYPEGRITREKFLGANRKFTDFGDDEFWNHIFNVLDDDKSGDVTFGEWIVALSTLTKGSTANKLDWLFNVFDIDGDGYIVRDEFLMILRLLYKVNPPVGMTVEELTDHVFKVVDANHDERITLDEFARGFKLVPMLQKNLNFLNQLVTSSLPNAHPSRSPKPRDVRSHPSEESLGGNNRLQPKPKVTRSRSAGRLNVQDDQDTAFLALPSTITTRHLSTSEGPGKSTDLELPIGRTSRSVSMTPKTAR